MYTWLVKIQLKEFTVNLQKSDIALVAIMLALCAILYALERIEHLIVIDILDRKNPLDIPPLKRVCDSEEENHEIYVDQCTPV